MWAITTYNESAQELWADIFLQFLLAHLICFFMDKRSFLISRVHFSSQIYISKIYNSYNLSHSSF